MGTYLGDPPSLCRIAVSFSTLLCIHSAQLGLAVPPGSGFCALAGSGTCRDAVSTCRLSCGSGSEARVSVGREDLALPPMLRRLRCANHA